MNYKVIFSKKAAKFVYVLEKSHKEKLKQIVMQLRNNPFSYPYKKIKGKENMYRIRIGKYRMLYEVDKINKRIIILKMDARGRVYKR